MELKLIISTRHATTNQYAESIEKNVEWKKFVFRVVGVDEVDMYVM